MTPPSPPLRGHYDTWIRQKQQQQNHCTSAGICIHWRETVTLWFVHSRQHLCNSEAKTGCWEASCIDKVWLWDTLNLLTHIHLILLCTGLTCIWERKKNAFSQLCNAKWVKSNNNDDTCSAGQPLQFCAKTRNVCEGRFAIDWLPNWFIIWCLPASVEFECAFAYRWILSYGRCGHVDMFRAGSTQEGAEIKFASTNKRAPDALFKVQVFY